MIRDCVVWSGWVSSFSQFLQQDSASVSWSLTTVCLNNISICLSYQRQILNCHEGTVSHHIVSIDYKQVLVLSNRGWVYWINPRNPLKPGEVLGFALETLSTLWHNSLVMTTSTYSTRRLAAALHYGLILCCWKLLNNSAELTQAVWQWRAETPQWLTLWWKDVVSL